MLAGGHGGLLGAKLMLWGFHSSHQCQRLSPLPGRSCGRAQGLLIIRMQPTWSASAESRLKSIKSNRCPVPGVRASPRSPGDGSLIQTLRLGTLGPGSPETFLTTHGSAHQPQQAASLAAESQDFTISQCDETEQLLQTPTQARNPGSAFPARAGLELRIWMAVLENQSWARGQSEDSRPNKLISPTGLMFRVKINLRFTPDT